MGFMGKLHYRKVRYWKYKTYKDFRIVLPYAFDQFTIYCKYLTLSEGVLIINAGYTWDGPSGPAIDTDNFMVPSLVHDALYQLLRETKLDNTMFRRLADEVFRDMALEEGMWKIRAWNAYYMVRIFYPVWKLFSKRTQAIPLVKVL